MSAGIVSWGTYLPHWRLKRTAIGLALEAPSGRGTRSVASYDEDTTTMAVEAARAAVAAEGTPPVTSLVFTTPAPAYLDKTNAAVIHAALGLDGAAGAYDLLGSVRSAVAAEQLGRRGEGSTLVVASDLRTGPAGGAEERDSGDGAAALLFGSNGAVAELIGEASASTEFLDRWRTPGELDSKVWEERFGEGIYLELASEAFAAALKHAGVTAEQVDHLIVSGLHARATKAIKGKLGVAAEAHAPDFTATVGNLGAAAPASALADVFERAQPGEVIVSLVLADGADAVVWRATDALPAAQQARAAAGLMTVAQQAAAGRDDLSYQRFLTWRGELRREPPRRPDPERPGAPATRRSDPWKHAFNASRCRQCGFRHLPPTRRCLECRAIDDMELERLADVPGTVATYTIDRLAFSLSPPVIGAIVDFDGGGRYRCEMTDANPDTIEIGQRVQMSFRRLSTAQGVHNYFWKARPVEAPGDNDAASEAKS